MKKRAFSYAAVIMSVAGHLAFFCALGTDGAIEQGASSGNLKFRKVVTVDLRKKATLSYQFAKEIAQKDEREKEIKAQDKEQSQIPKPVVDMAALIPIDLASEPYYFSSQELTEKPKVVQDVAPELSLDVADPLPSTVIRLLINEYGDVDQVIFEDPNFPVTAAMMITSAFKKMKFQPGMLENMPVRSQIKIEVTLQSILQMSEIIPKVNPVTPTSKTT